MLGKKLERALQSKLKEDVSAGLYDEIIPTEEMKENIISNSKRVINHVLGCEEFDENVRELLEDAILLYINSKRDKKEKREKKNK